MRVNRAFNLVTPPILLICPLVRKPKLLRPVLLAGMIIPRPGLLIETIALKTACLLLRTYRFTERRLAARLMEVGKTFPLLPFLSLLHNRPYYLVTQRSPGRKPVRTLIPPLSPHNLPWAVVQTLVTPLVKGMSMLAVPLTETVLVIKLWTSTLVMVTGNKLIGASMEK